MEKFQAHFPQLEIGQEIGLETGDGEVWILKRKGMFHVELVSSSWTIVSSSRP
jgi:hypothetical protein